MPDYKKFASFGFEKHGEALSCKMKLEEFGFYVLLTVKMESANGIVKTECLYNKFGKTKFKNRQIPIDDVVAEIESFIEYYNNERPKKSLGGL